MKHRLPALAMLAALAATLTAKALMMAPPPVGIRVATAHAVVVGKVTKLADKTVPGETFKGDERPMMIATVKVEKTLLGKHASEIKVGFFPPVAAPGGPIRIGGRGLSVNLVVDQEAMLMLQPHPTKKDVLVLGDFFGVINKKDNPNFKTELAEVQKSARLLADPMAGLKAKDADERLLATTLLVTRYRTPVGADTKTEKVSAEESKLILTNLAEADWTPGRGGRMDFQTNPQTLFYRLGLTPAEFTAPREPAKRVEAAKAWLKENAGKYQVVRYVRPALEAGSDPEP